MNEVLLSLKNIKKSFGETNVLKGISLDIGRGEFITLLGSSGCGKTTTLRIVAGLETPDEGQVILEGQDVTNLEPHKRDVNTVFQNHMTEGTILEFKVIDPDGREHVANMKVLKEDLQMVEDLKEIRQ